MSSFDDCASALHRGLGEWILTTFYRGTYVPGSGAWYAGVVSPGNPPGGSAKEFLMVSIKPGDVVRLKSGGPKMTVLGEQLPGTFIC